MMGDYMRKGKRISDFRNLNLEKSTEKINKTSNINKLSSSITNKEFIIEVEEKPRTNASKTKEMNKKSLKEGTSEKKQDKKNLNKKKKKEEKKKSPKTYIEEENIKNKKEKKKKTSKIVSAFLLTFIFIGVIAGCLTTPTFNVMQVDVEDGKNVYATEIEKYFTEVKGKNTFLINISELEEKITEHPYIYKAEINRTLPNRLTVEYKERKPYATLKYIESYILIDKYGSILEINKENKNPNLPIIYGIEAKEFIPGQKLDGVAELKFENSVYLLETASHISFNYTVSEINYTDSEEIRLSIEEQNIQIIYGAIEREILNDKMTYLNEVLKKLKDKKGTLDISSTNYSEKVIFTEILK